MSNPQRHRFPNASKPGATPGWLDRKGTPNEEIKTLLSILQGDPQPPQPYPSAAAPPPPPPPPPPAPPPEPELDFPQDNDLHSLEMPEELKLPGPPRLGSLLPGGRSNPPPANDHGDGGLSEHIQAFASAAIELAIARAANLAVLEGQLLDLAIEVAEALIEKEVEADPSLHSALARAALASIGDASHVTLRTSPDGFSAIVAALGGEDVEVRGVRVQVISDASIPGLGCVVDGEAVRVDATVAERLRAVRRAFEEERRRATESVE
ncbi:MAG TPA: FliH/SctL family protein [Polyangiales bacterium]|nr:FliH/SctL family protein [Polyangiales bacterium]